MNLQGKGFFTFILPECEGGNPVEIVSTAKVAGLSHVLVKIADGVNPFGITPSIDYTTPVVRALHEAGIAVWGWHYVYGDNPLAEAAIAISRVQALDLDGYVVDAEDEYKKPGKEAAARQFMEKLRAALDIPIALSSYRFPNYHPELPWSAFLEKCDLHMPQMYWEQAHNAGWQLRESKRQCDALPNARPYIPTGAAYGTPPVWDPTPADAIDFLNTAKSLGLPAVNFFDWGSCRTDLPELWNTIAAYSWSGAPAPQPPAPAPQPITPVPVDFIGKFISILGSRQAARVIALYDPAAVQVQSDKILRTPAEIQNNYVTFFAGFPAGTTFSKIQARTSGDMSFITWRAGVTTGQTTLVVKNEKILLEYTFLE
jgi:hypothetical protein